MGSTLKIANIALFIDSKWLFFPTATAALMMFEQIINGRFVDTNKRARIFLRKLLRKATQWIWYRCDALRPWEATLLIVLSDFSFQVVRTLRFYQHQSTDEGLLGVLHFNVEAALETIAFKNINFHELL